MQKTRLVNRILFRMALPAGVLFLTAILFIAIYVPGQIEKNAVDEAVDAAQRTVVQFKTLRKYYTENVVSKVKADRGIAIETNHKNRADTIPLPATMIHDLSEELRHKGTTMNLYSAFPFSNRKNRVLDPFQKTAWESLRDNPDMPFYRRMKYENREVVRVAISDKMISSVCVNCHNSHPDSPKTDWRLGDVRGVLEVVQPIEAQLGNASVIAREITLWIGIVLVAVLAVTYLIYRREVERPVRDLSSAMQEVAAGDGDLTRRLHANGKNELSLVAEAFNTFIEKIHSMVVDVIDRAQTIGSASSEISLSNVNLSQRTEEQASSLEETASSMEEMTSTVNRNAENAGQARDLSIAARNHAELGGEIVGKAVVAMTEINESSGKIVDIIGVIDGIAFQTNLLALNAAVEAARAGDNGRGFAVVASEVRNLAQRCADAAKEIKELIQDSVQRVEQGTSLVNQSGESLKEIVLSIKEVSDIIAEIAAAGSEQASGIEQVNQAVTQMDGMTQQNAAVVEQVAAASRSLEEQAMLLNEQIAFFKVDARVNVLAPSRVERMKGYRSESSPKVIELHGDNFEQEQAI